MRCVLSLIVLTLVLDSVRNSSSVKTKPFRRNSNSTIIRNNSNQRKEELFKLKKILKKFGNQGRTTPLPYLSASTNAGGSVDTTNPPLSTGTNGGTTDAGTTARAPPRQGRNRQSRRKRRRRRRKGRKNRVYRRFQLVLRRQRFQQFYRSALRPRHRTGLKRTKIRTRPVSRSSSVRRHRASARRTEFLRRVNHQNRRNLRNKQAH